MIPTGFLGFALGGLLLPIAEMPALGGVIGVCFILFGAGGAVCVFSGAVLSAKCGTASYTEHPWFDDA